MVAFNFNAQGITPEFGYGGGTVWANGWHKVIIASNTVRDNSDKSSGQHLGLTLKNEGGEEGYIAVNLYHAKPDVRARAESQMAAIMFAVGVFQLSDTDQMNNLPFFVENAQKPNDSTGKVRNNFVAVRDINGREPGKDGGTAVQGNTPQMPTMNGAPQMPAPPQQFQQPQQQMGFQQQAPQPGQFAQPGTAPFSAPAGMPGNGAPAFGSGPTAPQTASPFNGQPQQGFQPGPGQQPNGFGAPAAPSFGAPGAPAGNGWAPQQGQQPGPQFQPQQQQAPQTQQGSQPMPAAGPQWASAR